jgi:hypothetical protein
LSTEDQGRQSTFTGGLLYASGSNVAESRNTTINKNNSESNSNNQNSNNNNNNINNNNNNNIDFNLLEKFNKVLFQRPGSRALSVPSYFPFASINFSTNSNLLLNPVMNNNNKMKAEYVK